MVKEAIATGTTVEEAHEKACAMLGVETTHEDFEILEMPEKKSGNLFTTNHLKKKRKLYRYNQNLKKRLKILQNL